jgi:serine protease
MKRSVVALFSILLTTAAFAAETIETRRYLVGTKLPFSASTIRALRDSVDNVVEPRAVQGFESFRGFAAELTAGEVEKLRSSREVRWVEPVIPRYALDVERNLAGQTITYGVDQIFARQANLGKRTGQVNVVIVDTGIDSSHVELKDIFMGGYNVFSNNDNVIDDHGHGTHVSGTIAAADNNQGVIGVSPNVRLWSVKALNRSGAGTNEGILEALDWIRAKKEELGGNWVVNMSLGAPGESVGEREAFQKMADAGIIVVAAAGNSSTPNRPMPVGFPGAYPTVIAVAAVDDDRNLAYFSSQGPEVDFAAPGVEVLSTVPTDSNLLAYVRDAEKAYRADPIIGTDFGTVQGDYVFCGIGRPEDFPASMTGKIALIKRGGEISFANKTRAAKAKGAIAVVIFNNDTTVNEWTLFSDDQAGQEDWPLVVKMRLTDGQALADKGSGRMTVSYNNDSYGENSGTSMACPHVAGAVALLWALAPNATPEQIVNAMSVTALDLGTAGPDNEFGLGLVNVYTAAKMLAPGAFQSSTTGRRPGTRGKR